MRSGRPHGVVSDAERWSLAEWSIERYEASDQSAAFQKP
jgi:hypothetical protein